MEGQKRYISFPAWKREVPLNTRKGWGGEVFRWMSRFTVELLSMSSDIEDSEDIDCPQAEYNSMI